MRRARSLSLISGPLSKKLSIGPPQKEKADRSIEKDKEIVLDETKGAHLTRPFGKEDHPKKDRHRAHGAG